MILPAFLIFLILQTSFALPTHVSSSSQPEPANPMDEVANILPLKEIQELKKKHLQTDLGFQAAISYFKSPEWVRMIEDVRKTPEWIEYKSFLKDAGLDLDYVIKHLEHCLNGTDTTQLEIEGVKPSMGNFFDDVKKTYGVPIMKGIHDYMKKAGQTGEYKKFVETVMSPKSKAMFEKAVHQSALDKLLQKLKDLDVNVDFLMQLVYSFTGWQPLATTLRPF